MTYLLEVNDCELSLYQDDTLEYHAPAVAVVREGEILFGEPALRLSRTHPRETNQQYFARLNADPLAHPVARATNHADLVYLHLQQLQQMVQQNPAEVLLAVPGTLSNDQLGVLLGIAQECGLEIGGFVDTAVLAASLSELPPSIYHIDTHLQQMCITHLESNAEVRRTSAEEIAECGFANLLDGWVNVIADRFVRDTRFDPLHAAETEQQLYNQVYDWVTSGDGLAEIGIDIDYRDHVRRVELPRALLEDKAQQRFKRLRDGLPDNVPVLLSARSARLPGLKQFLASQGHEFTVLASNAVAMGCMANLDNVRSTGGQLRLVSKLALRAPLSTAGSEQSITPAVASDASTRPTHILSNNIAAAIAGLGHSLPLSETEAGVHLEALDGLLLNGKPLTGPTRLRIGDEIIAGPLRCLMIRVDH
jgi:hypothetical protein